MGGIDQEDDKKTRGRSKKIIKSIHTDTGECQSHWTYLERIKERILEFHKNDTPDRNKLFKLHDNGIQVIYGSTRSFNSNYRKKQYLMNNAYTEKADLILVSESGFVDGAQPYIDGYE